MMGEGENGSEGEADWQTHVREPRKDRPNMEREGKAEHKGKQRDAKTRNDKGKETAP